MFVLVHGAADSFWAEVERRFVGATVSMDRERMLRLDERFDADDAWARARELLELGLEKGVFDLRVHVVSTWDERERPPGLPLGFVFLSESVGRTLLSRDANQRRAVRVAHENWRGWVDVGPGEAVPPPLTLRPDVVERFVVQSRIRPGDGGVLSREHRVRAKPVDELIASVESRCVRVLAPARTGKSYVAERLDEWARQAGYENVVFTRLCREEPSPSWRWVDREQETAIWIVDGVDEAVLHGRVDAELLRALNELDEAARQRLRLVLFQRDEGYRSAFDAKLKALGLAPSDWNLLPIDEIEARRILAEKYDSVSLEQVIELSTKHGVAKNRWLSPPMIQALAAVLERATSPDPREVWREVRNASVAPVPATVDRARLRTLAERVAVVTLLSGCAIDDRLLAAVLEDATELEHRALLRTELFVAQSDGSVAFRERHVEESLAVGRLENAPLRVLQRLFTHEGALRAEAMGLVEPLQDVRPKLEPLLRKWRADRGRPLAPESAANALRRLASKQTRWVGDRRLARLAHPSIDEVLCEILDSSPLPPGYRVVFEVAKHRDRWERFDAALVKLLQEPSRSWELRAEAAYHLFYRDDRSILAHADLEMLYEAIAAEPAPDEDHARVDRANVLALVLVARLRRMPAAWEHVASIAPRPDRGRYDARTLLQDVLEETMTAERAWWVLDRAGSMPKGLRKEASRIAVSQGALDEKWLGLVTKERTRNEVVRRALEERWRDDVEARRFSFEHELWRGGSSDVAWLLELAQSTSEHAPRARNALFGLARSDAAARRAVETHFEEEWTRWLEAQRREEETWRGGLPAPKPEAPRPYLLNELRKRLDPETEPTKRFRALTFLCFSRFAHHRFRGSFAEADRALRAAVLHELRALLRQVAPTPIPSGSSHSTRIADEAAAFVYAVVQSDHLEWLDEGTLRRWLPTALFVGHEHLAYCLELCTEQHADVTREVAMEQLRLDVRRREHPVVASSLPSRWLTEALPSLLQDSSDDTVEHRARLLDLARERGAVPSAALRAWAATEARGEGPLAVACTRWLLSDPITRAHGVRALLEIPVEANDRLAACLRELAPTFFVDRRRFESWSDEHVLALLERLCLAPVSWDELPDGIVTDQHRLQALRDTLIAIGVERVGEPALERLPSEGRDAHRWRLDVAESATITTELDVVLAEPARLSVREVLRILNGVTEPRGLDDVFFDVVEALHAIAEDVGEHSYLLLRSESSPSHADAALGSAEASSRPLHEKALQEYLHARLKSAFGKRYTLSREPIEAYGDEPDFVLGCTIEGESRSVPIEVKWSTHSAWKTALENQLVRQYLTDQHRTHGIYVVGFAGAKRATGKKTSAQEQVGGCRESLEAERDRILDLHPELRVEVIVLPVVRD
jgi:hypothetical protein